MFEHHSKPLLAKDKYYQRLIWNFFWGIVIVGLSLFMGMLGYHITENLGWLDSLLNASMILTGMGPVNVVVTTAGKLFASFYAIFSGVAFLTTVTVMFAPILHRFLHKFHLQDK